MGVLCVGWVCAVSRERGLNRGVLPVVKDKTIVGSFVRGAAEGSWVWCAARGTPQAGSTLDDGVALRQEFLTLFLLLPTLFFLSSVRRRVLWGGGLELRV